MKLFNTICICRIFIISACCLSAYAYANVIKFNTDYSAKLFDDNDRLQSDSYAREIKIGATALRNSSFLLAQKSAQNAISENNNGFEGHLLLVLSYLAQSKDPLLYLHLKEVAVLRPGFFSPLCLNLAQYYLNNQQYYRAINILERVTDPNFSHNKLKLLAQSYEGQKRLDLAIKTHKKILSQSPTERSSLLALARIYLAQDNYQLASKTSLLLIKLEPLSRKNRLIYGVSKLLSNEPETAFNTFNWLKDSDLDDKTTESYRAISLFLMGDSDKALALINEIMNTGEIFPIESFFVKALFELNSQKYQSVQQTIKDLQSRIKNEDPLIYVFQVASDAKTQDNKINYRILSKANKLITDLDYYPLLANKYPITAAESIMFAEVALLYRQGFHRVIIKKLSKENIVNTFFGIGLYYARAHWQLGQSDKALKIYSQLIAQYPTLIAPRAELADIYYYQKQGDKALTIYSDIVNSYPDNVQLKTRYANLHNSLGNYKEAITIYKDILTKNKSIYIYNQLAATYAEKARDYKSALKYAQLGDHENSSNLVIKDTLANIYSKLGKHHKALALYDELLDKTNNTLPAKTFFNIATSYDAMGQNNQAKLYYELSLNTGQELGYSAQAKKRLRALWLDSH